MPVRVDSKKEAPTKLSVLIVFAVRRSAVVHPQRDNVTYPMILIRFTFILYILKKKINEYK